ncbi:MAG TPA: ABC transporter permease [Gemmatimonadaceae bacterium]|nr:ABC transporter permease [Gemmatimonadaceae bacterium]
MFDAFRQDLTYAVRGLRTRPGFAAAVALTLGLGIGANAAMFSLVDRLLFRPPPLMPDPGTAHRVYLFQTFRGTERANGSHQYARYTDLAQWSTSFSNSAGYTERELAVGVGDAAREMQIGIVSASFFSFFDAPAVLGRYFTAAEDMPPLGTPVAVLSYAFWQTQYGGRRDALGSTVQIGPVLYTVIGVAPRAFVGLWPDQPPAAFIPITSYAGAASASLTLRSSWWKTYQWGWMSMIMRRKPGVSIAAASADLTNAFQKSFETQLVENPRNTPASLARPHAVVASILSERGPNESSVAKVATWVGGVALIVLLIACANVANLLLARALRRRREIAIRLALGVSRARLLSQLLTESVLLALLGGTAGVLVAQWGGSALRAAFLPGTAQSSVVGDTRTLLFAGAAALGAGLLTGLASILQWRRADLTSDLKAGAREGTFHRSRARAALLVLQGALSVMLLVGAGLFVRSLHKVQALRLGYDVDPVLLVNLNMRGIKLDSARKVDLRTRLLETARTIPGVTHASTQSSVPFWSTWSVGLYVAGIDSVNKLGEFDLNAVSPEFFATLGTRIVRGRGIEAGDTQQAPRAMVVSEAMSKTLWPAADPIGQCVKIVADTMPCTYVVGIAENIKASALNNDPGLYYYLPSAQFSPQTGGLVIRTAGNASAQMATVRRRLQREMPGASYVTITPFGDIVGSQTRSWQLGATMFVVFGALALALAAIGLYSVIAYNVVQRTHEMGVRVALGAQVGDVVRLVVAEGLRVGVMGVAIGTGIALAAGRWVRPLLFEESPRDPAVFAFVAIVLLAVAVLASWIPARRAARVDPNQALRGE